MIRIFRQFPLYSNTLRYTQYSAIRLCSKKPDDPFIPVDDPVEEEAETVSKTKSFESKQSVHSKYAQTNGNSNESVFDLLETLPHNPKATTKETLLNIYCKIRENGYLLTDKTIAHRLFDQLRAATTVWLPKLTTKEVNYIFITLVPFKSIIDDKLTEDIVNELIKRSTFIPFDQILRLDCKIRKQYGKHDLMKLNRTFMMLLMRFQTLFLSKIDDELDARLDEPNDFEKLIRIIAYCDNNAEIVSEKLLNTLTTLLLMADDELFNVQNLKSIIIFLASFGKLNEHVQKLLNKVVQLWQQSPINIEDIQILFKVLAAKSESIDKEMFENTNFIQHCINIVIQQNEKRAAFAIQNSFNKIGLISVDLIDYLSKAFESKESIRELSISDYIIFCRACTRAEYKPANWDSSIMDALKVFNFSLYLTGLRGFDWPKFAITLDKLGYRDIKLMKNILKSNHLKKQNHFDQLSLNKLKEILDECEPSTHNDEDSDDHDDQDYSDAESFGISYDEDAIYKDLKVMFGEENIWCNFKINSELIVPYVMKMNMKSGDFLEMNATPSLHDPDNLLVGIIVVEDQNEKQMKKEAKKQSFKMSRLGICSIIIEQSKWNTLKGYEKSLVFYTKIMNMIEVHQKRKLYNMGKI